MFSFPDSGGFKIEIHRRYLGEGDKGYIVVSREDFFKQYDKILRNIREIQGLHHKEKKAQQKLVFTNNQNPGSRWYCVDLEYIQQRKDNREPYYGSFEISCGELSPSHMENQPEF